MRFMQTKEIEAWVVLRERIDENVEESRLTLGSRWLFGGSVEVGGDEVVVGGEEEKGDKAIVGGEDVRGGGERDCVDGLAGLEIGEKKKGEEEEEKDGGGPILFIISDRISKSFKNGQVFRVLPSSNVFQFPALCSLFLGPACLSALVGQRPSIIVFLLATTIFALAMWGWDSKYGSQD
ncbi:hypothetical protein C1H46_036761 [Malus baccata]|uniref:Uncharacterized protein n=1 Tax=Malus baccata TaxID=106549 RepID=A0A540KU04_MALBA|nr:hypothetical protein C1H46_036761 [Malus baccata]